MNEKKKKNSADDSISDPIYNNKWEILLNIIMNFVRIVGIPLIFQKNFLRRWERLRQQKVGLFESPRLRFY